MVGWNVHHRLEWFASVPLPLVVGCSCMFLLGVTKVLPLLIHGHVCSLNPNHGQDKKKTLHFIQQ